MKIAGEKLRTFVFMPRSLLREYLDILFMVSGIIRICTSTPAAWAILAGKYVSGCYAHDGNRSKGGAWMSRIEGEAKRVIGFGVAELRIPHARQQECRAYLPGIRIHGIPQFLKFHWPEDPHLKLLGRSHYGSQCSC